MTPSVAAWFNFLPKILGLGSNSGATIVGCCGKIELYTLLLSDKLLPGRRSLFPKPSAPQLWRINYFPIAF
jgi:hypothetical protein